MLRRNFLSSVAATAGAITLGGKALSAQTAPGKKPELKLALLGCGGRGAWIGNLFAKHGGYKIHAIGDYFPHRIKRAGDSLRVPESHRFSGLSAYKRLLDTKPDVIAIIVAPWFHPRIAEEAVAVGVHVYLAKPVAVDVPGCLSIEASGKRATENKLCFLVDFQTRTDAFFIEAMRRIHSGDIGAPIFGEAFYHSDSPGSHARPGSHGERIANWRFDAALGGEIIVERDVHVLDMMNWAMNNTPPLHVYGVSGRKQRLSPGNVPDYCTALYQYPNNTGITFTSREFRGYGSTPEGIGLRLFGTKGILESKYAGYARIRGEKAYPGGKCGNLYQAGAVANIKSFYEAVISSDYSNSTVAPSVRATMLAILGREAAAKNTLLKWEDILKDTNRREADLKGLRD
ncbi:MAG: Gfo/Idh/MocA family oxidoreductase [Puniceicoccales bacterium]|nr:Gfo/Idh/MocA family oxidoreductase [Puniceicoccales bacterium]